MSIAPQRCKFETNIVRRSDCNRGRSGSPETEAGLEDRRLAAELEDDKQGSSSSSSIGGNSDDSGESSDEGEDYGKTEAQSQSTHKGPLDSMDALEESLPIKRGMSKFYRGKSKSFTSLADAASLSSTKNIAKPEDPYTKKRKNVLAHRHLWDKSQDHTSRNNHNGLAKRPVNLSEAGSSGDAHLLSSSPSCSLPPLHPPVKKSPVKGPSTQPPPGQNSPWRSFSLSDLQSIDTTSPNIAISICSGGKDGRQH